jgi:preprotein translocase subunit SecA
MQFQHPDMGGYGADEEAMDVTNALGLGAGVGGAATAAFRPVPDGTPKVGRNDPCPCGSGKKYKQCHGQLA